MFLKKIAVITTLFLTPLTCSADVLLINVINEEPINSEVGLLRPTKGQSMSQVKVNFGEPVKVYIAVGEPPITRWKYSKFSVYFERNHVIHSVVNKPPKTR